MQNRRFCRLTSRLLNATPNLYLWPSHKCYLILLATGWEMVHLQLFRPKTWRIRSTMSPTKTVLSSASLAFYIFRPLCRISQTSCVGLLLSCFPFRI